MNTDPEVRMSNNTVAVELADGVATVTLDRPDTLNAMTPALMDDVREAVELVDATESARVLVITGAGRGFCSGADLSVGAPAAGSDGSDGSDGDPTRLMTENFHPAIRSVLACRVPTVARIKGPVAGGGLGLALACDVTIAASSAFFVATFGPRLGIVPDLGSTWQLPMRVGRARALGMALLGDRITAAEAADWGLIYRVVDDSQLDAEVERANNILRRSSPEATRRIRAAIGSANERSLVGQLDVEQGHQRVLIPMNMGEGAAAFMERREPDFNT